MRVTTSPEASRTPIKLLTDRSFGPYFAGKLASSFGVWVQNIVMAIVMFRLTGSALAVGAVSMLQFIPQVLISPWAGALSDRVDRRHQLMVGRLISTTAASTLAIWTGVTGVAGLPGPGLILGAALALGIGFSISAPAMHSLVPSLVPPKDLDGAIALNSVTGNIARGAGPALGTATLLLLGPAVAFGLSAAAHASYIIALASIRARPVDRASGGDRSVRAVLRYVRGTPVMGALLLGATALGFAVDPVITLTPPLAAVLGGGEALVGTLASAFGIGAAVTIVFLTRIRRRLGLARLGLVGLSVTAAGLAGLAVSPTAEVAVSAMFVAGCGFLLATTSLVSRLQRRVPEELRGRVMALWGVASVGSRPFAALVNGTLADFVSVRLAFLFSAALSVAAAVFVWRKAPVSRIGQQSGEPPPPPPSLE